MTENPTGTAPAFGTASALLWSLREALERVLFKLVEEQLVLTSGSTRWLHHADEEVRVAISALQAGEVVRAMELDELARSLGMPDDASLADFAEAAPESWRLVLSDHRSALRALVREIDAVATENRRLLKAGVTAIRDTLDRLSQTIATYDMRGDIVSSGSGPLLLDEQA